MYVIETDAPCAACGDDHGVATHMCDLVVYTDWGTAHWVAGHIEGSVVREIDKVPEGLSYHLNIHKQGRPDPNAPQTSVALPSI